MWALGFAIFVLGLIFVIVAPINKRKNTRCSAETQGTLINIIERRNSDGRLPSMYLYSYSVNGVEYQTKSTFHSSEADEVGDQCTIWYNPKKPQAAQPFHYGSTKIYNIILIVGIAMLVLGIVLTLYGVAHSM